MILKTIATHYPVAKAHSIAEELRSGDADWDYVVVEGGNGLARIDIFDEDGEFVSSYGSTN